MDPLRNNAAEISGMYEWLAARFYRIRGINVSLDDGV